MRCSGSPITSTVPNAVGAHAPSLPDGRLREAAASFSAMLLRDAFAPLGKALGFYGDTVVGLVTQTLARNERGGLTDRLERSLEDATRPRALDAERGS